MGVIFSEASVHECEDGSSGSGDRIQIRPIVEKAATTALILFPL